MKSKFNLENARQINDIDEIRKIELEILTKFDKFCRENGIRYVLTAGTLLGAVRHGGFIPWDDDIDIAIFRPDYEKLISLSKKMGEDFALLNFENDNNYSRLYARIVNKKYVSRDKYYSKRFTNYFGIDVFPIESVPNENADRYFKKLKVLRQMFIFSQSALFKGNGALKKYVIKPVPILLCKFIGRERIYKMFYKTVKNVDVNSSDSSAVVTGVYNRKELLTNKDYYDIINIYFDGLATFSVKNYEKYLTSIFGDYNKLPPENERIPHHNYILYSLE